jgi:DNA-binding transcriptional LysR family regulator
VSELESHLGARLLIRSSRRLGLTEAGQSYVAACRRILEEVAEAERAAAGEYSAPRGGLLITAPIVFGRLHVVPVITDFLKAYPEIDIQLVLADSLISFAEDHVDLAVRIGGLPDSSLVATRIGAIRRITCASRAYLHARGRPRKPEDLRTHDCITGRMLGTSWTYRVGKSETDVPVRSRLSVNTAEAAIDAAIAGVGITRVLSYQVAAAKRAGAIELLLEEFEQAPWPVSLVYDRQGLLPLKLRAFLDFAAPRLKESILGSTV